MYSSKSDSLILFLLFDISSSSLGLLWKRLLHLISLVRYWQFLLLVRHQTEDIEEGEVETKGEKWEPKERGGRESLLVISVLYLYLYS